VCCMQNFVLGVGVKNVGWVIQFCNKLNTVTQQNLNLWIINFGKTNLNVAWNLSFHVLLSTASKMQ
jgi:hypothetical protein